MKKILWKNYPELTKEFRNKKEDNLAKDTLIIHKKFSRYLEKHDYLHLLGDLQGAVHLLQGILIEIQKERYNNRILNEK